MISFRIPGTVGVASVLAAALFGCSALDDDLAGGGPPVTTTAGALIKQQENPQPGGFVATVSLISNFNGTGGWPDGRTTNTVRLAACNGFTRMDGTVGAQLYVVTSTTAGSRRLYVANDAGKDYVTGDPNNLEAGTTWKQITSQVPASDKIGCDGHHLFVLSATNNLYVAGTTGDNGDLRLRRGDGTFDVWTSQGINPLFADLQSGAGNLYVIGPGTTKSLYTQDSTKFGTWKTFANLPSNFVRVTGAGKESLATLARTAGNKFSGKNPPNRAFALKTDGTLVYNDKVLSSPTANTWTALDFGSATFEDISVSAPDVLWAITNSGGMRHLHEIRFTETSCKDGRDNDADGLTDGQDPECQVPLARDYCAAVSSKIYCSSRFSNSADFLVRCFNGVLDGAPDPGRCVENATTHDAKIALAIPEPPDTGRWCSAVYRPGGRWSVKTEVSSGVTNSDPCAFIQANQPAGQTTEITGAGLFSLTGMNNVVGFCQDGFSAGRINQGRINGTAPIDDIVAFLGNHTGCKVLVSPGYLPIFDLPYDKAAVSALGATVGYGLVFDPASHGAWDIMVPEGVPLLAVATGRVVGVVTDPATTLPHGGSEDLPATAAVLGDSYQPGIMIVHDVRSGTNARYREMFVSVYAHMRQRIVVPGQLVQKGQVIGYIGQVGQATGPHVHFGVVRLSNTALSATDPDTGSTFVKYDPWPIRTEVTTTSIVSPFGWRGAGQDPWGMQFADEGRGAFSPYLWNGTAQTPSPLPARTPLGW